MIHTDPQRGAATVERLGLVVVTVVLVLALIAGATASGAGETLQEAWCKIMAAATGSSTASCGAGTTTSGTRSADDFVPPQACVVSNAGGEKGVNERDGDSSSV